eukprot:CAMPEP_0184869946 /NCGR_PEP_ID=MMETSP0580-20130426/35923_1 /TAXON_ID=1118495 /ORGANISM="Dactyliosolen fragilissimus" /LENGTH=402 /DNA_ID=CAMNT_0027371785 /DNA_START=168 /DNA_END=1373 /DNA_ORIENTATION=+
MRVIDGGRTSICNDNLFKRRVRICSSLILLPMQISHISAFVISHETSVADNIRSNKLCRSGIRKCGGNNFRRTAKTNVKEASTHKNAIKFKGDGSILKDRDGGESFALEMASQQLETTMESEKDTHHEAITEDIDDVDSDNFLKRRGFLCAVLTSATTAAATTSSEPANAFDKAYPQTLEFENGDTSINLESIRNTRISVQRNKVEQSRKDLATSPLKLRTKLDVLSSGVWSLALWLLFGSRSNPLVKPLGNLLYDQSNQPKWLEDRNAGLFSPLPLGFTFLLGVVFWAMGIMTDRALLLLSDDSGLVLQLAGVTLIGGGALELGRIASGEKLQTRSDAERDEELAREFDEFASRKLIIGQGGSLHRSEVVKSFRRTFAKYRIENDDYPLSDLEIEKLLREW